MTIPPGLRAGAQKVSETVLNMFPKLRSSRLTSLEQALVPHLRGNTPLYEALKDLIKTRIEARARVPEPSEPLVAKSMIARDRELQWLLSTLEHLYKAPVDTPAQEDSEPPA